jgi:transposase
MGFMRSERRDHESLFPVSLDERVPKDHVCRVIDAFLAAALVTSEPEAKQMKGHGPAYNVQTVVDAGHGLILTHAVTAEATDNTSLQPLVEAARDALGQPGLKVVADAGYSNGAQAEALEAQGIVPHVPANRAVNNQGDCSLFDRRCFTYDEATDTMRCPAGEGLQCKQLQRGQYLVLYAADVARCAAVSPSIPSLR